MARPTRKELQSMRFPVLNLPHHAEPAAANPARHALAGLVSVFGGLRRGAIQAFPDDHGHLAVRHAAQTQILATWLIRFTR